MLLSFFTNPLVLYLLAWTAFLLILYEIIKKHSLSTITIIFPFIIYQGKHLTTIMNIILRKFMRLPLPEKRKKQLESFLFYSSFLLLLGSLFLAILNSWLVLFNNGLSITIRFPLNEYNPYAIFLLFISFFLVILIHEFGHAIFISKTLSHHGKWLLAVFPPFLIMFFNLPKKTIYSLTSKRKILFISGGSFMNFFFVFLLLPIILYYPSLFSFFFGPSQGALITHITPNSPASQTGLSEGDVIIQIAFLNTSMKIYQAIDVKQALSLYSQSNASRLTIMTLQSKTITLKLSTQTQNIQTLGIHLFNYYPLAFDKSGFFMYYLSFSVSWFFWFNLTLGLLNLLPLWITDGDKIFQEFLVTKRIPQQFLSLILLLLRIIAVACVIITMLPHYIILKP